MQYTSKPNNLGSSHTFDVCFVVHYARPQASSFLNTFAHLLSTTPPPPASESHICIPERIATTP